MRIDGVKRAVNMIRDEYNENIKQVLLSYAISRVQSAKWAHDDDKALFYANMYDKITSATSPSDFNDLYDMYDMYEEGLL